MSWGGRGPYLQSYCARMAAGPNPGTVTYKVVASIKGLLQVLLLYCSQASHSCTRDTRWRLPPLHGHGVVCGCALSVHMRLSTEDGSWLQDWLQPVRAVASS